MAGEAATRVANKSASSTHRVKGRLERGAEERQACAEDGLPARLVLRGGGELLDNGVRQNLDILRVAQARAEQRQQLSADVERRLVRRDDRVERGKGGLVSVAAL